MKSKEGITVIERFENGGLTAYSIDNGKTFHSTIHKAFEYHAEQEKEKKISDAVRTYVAHLLPLITEARGGVVKAGASPNVMYIGDIFSVSKDELTLSPMKLDTGCKILGMKIIADYRVPINKFYIMQGEL